MNKKIVIAISSIVFVIALVLGVFIALPILSVSSWTAKAKEQVKLLVEANNKVEGTLEDVEYNASEIKDASKKVQEVYDVANSVDKKIGESVGIGGIDITGQYAKAEKQQKKLKEAVAEYKESVKFVLFAAEAGAEMAAFKDMKPQSPAAMKSSADKLKEAGKKIVKYAEDRDVTSGKKLGKLVSELGEAMDKASDAYNKRDRSALLDAQREILKLNTDMAKEAAEYRKQTEKSKKQLEDAREDINDIKKELDS